MNNGQKKFQFIHNDKTYIVEASSEYRVIEILESKFNHSPVELKEIPYSSTTQGVYGIIKIY